MILTDGSEVFLAQTFDLCEGKFRYQTSRHKFPTVKQCGIG